MSSSISPGIKHICTAERPFRSGYQNPLRWVHPDAAEVQQSRRYSKGGETRLLRCPHCNAEVVEFIPYGSPLLSDTIRLG